jgi:hypothetical protein
MVRNDWLGPLEETERPGELFVVLSRQADEAMLPCLGVQHVAAEVAVVPTRDVLAAPNPAGQRPGLIPETEAAVRRLPPAAKMARIR